MTTRIRDLTTITDHLLGKGWFRDIGAYVLVDGQFGSTGKGLLAHVMAYAAMGHVNAIVTNAGPNSGHTTIMEDGEVIMTQQIPVMSVVLSRMGMNDDVRTFLNGGAVVDLDILMAEVDKYDVHPYVHSAAAMITSDIKNTFGTGSMDAIASTGKGVGQAMAGKVLRMGNVAKNHVHDLVTYNKHNFGDEVVFVETAQGFSLGYNEGFYPYCTSRSCTVGQALADADIHPHHLQKSIMAIRTYPIRVGNTGLGDSGPCYSDQKEIEWTQIGQTPELTTVTKRVRRLFTFSTIQYKEALEANRPDAIFLNFCNYLTEEQLEQTIEKVQNVYYEVMRKPLETLLLGFGPSPSEVELYHG